MYRLSIEHDWSSFDPGIILLYTQKKIQSAYVICSLHILLFPLSFSPSLSSKCTGLLALLLIDKNASNSGILVMCFPLPENLFPRYLRGSLPNLNQASERTFLTALFNTPPQSLFCLFPCFCFSLTALSLPTLCYIFNCRLFFPDEWKLQERRDS